VPKALSSISFISAGQKEKKMKRTIKGSLVAIGVAISTMTAQAQLSTNPDKFLGNITTGWNSELGTDGYIFSDY
jgi:hypothetical protein